MRALAHVAWVVLNVGIVPGLEPWDPYPFVFLATVASAEAPFIALLVLMRQQQDRRVDELREETSLQVALHVEREATRLLRMMGEAHRALGMRGFEDDPEFRHMTSGLDPRALLEEVTEELERAGPDRSG